MISRQCEVTGPFSMPLTQYYIGDNKNKTELFTVGHRSYWQISDIILSLKKTTILSFFMIVMFTCIKKLVITWQLIESHKVIELSRHVHAQRRVSIATNENFSGEKIEVVVKGSLTKTCRMRWSERISPRIVAKYISRGAAKIISNENVSHKCWTGENFLL